MLKIANKIASVTNLFYLVQPLYYSACDCVHDMGHNVHKLQAK